jgi:hypothetical protein
LAIEKFLRRQVSDTSKQLAWSNHVKVSDTYGDREIFRFFFHGKGFFPLAGCFMLLKKG